MRRIVIAALAAALAAGAPALAAPAAPGEVPDAGEEVIDPRHPDLGVLGACEGHPDRYGIWTRPAPGLGIEPVCLLVSEGVPNTPQTLPGPPVPPEATAAPAPGARAALAPSGAAPVPAGGAARRAGAIPCALWRGSVPRLTALRAHALRVAARAPRAATRTRARGVAARLAAQRARHLRLIVRGGCPRP